MNIPKNLYYTKQHEWIKFVSENAIIGITDYAQSELGDIIFVELPSKGISVKRGESVGTIEAVKTVADLYTPLNGNIVEVNKDNDQAEHSVEVVYETGFGWLDSPRENPLVWIFVFVSMIAISTVFFISRKTALEPVGGSLFDDDSFDDDYDEEQQHR